MIKTCFFVVVITYPSGSSRYAESPDVMELLSHDLRDFNNVYGDTCDTVITGDFNARTGTLVLVNSLVLIDKAKVWLTTLYVQKYCTVQLNNLI